MKRYKVYLPGRPALEIEAKTARREGSGADGVWLVFRDDKNQIVAEAWLVPGAAYILASALTSEETT